MNALAEVAVIEQSLARLRTLLSPAESMKMPHLSQRDPRWANEVYSAGEIFAASGCLVVCVTMVAAQARPDLTPPQVAEALHTVGAFEGSYLSHPSRIPQAFPWLSWDGVVHWRTVPARIVDLVQMIADHGPTIIEVKWDPRDRRSPEKGNQHFVVATAVLPGLDDVTVVDPWDGEEKSLLTSRYALPMRWSVETAIHGARRLWPTSS